MKKISNVFKAIFLLITLVFTSCQINSLRGRKLYLLNLTVNSLPMMKEIECDFIDIDKVEIRMTLFGYLDQFKTYKTDSTIYEESKIYNYSYKNGFLEIPDLKVNAKLTEDGKGNYLTSTNEMFYNQSIVEILTTQEAKDRITKASPMANITNMYLEMLNNSSNGGFQVTLKDGKLYNSQVTNQQTDMHMDTAKKDINNNDPKETQDLVDSVK